MECIDIGKNYLVEKANLKDGDIALDICTGTGDIAFKTFKKSRKKMEKLSA
ncbi:MAG: hypothetical protein KatS3mg068_0786 [Candidatus Sericytochromatia bacterium]|nr:MAG: hypothetical protein KatS3mg068_0786 [Candidatus Sericytochromatia bacterium]